MNKLNRCEWCGKDFKPIGNEGSCSRKCRYEMNTKQELAAAEEKERRDKLTQEEREAEDELLEKEKKAAVERLERFKRREQRKLERLIQQQNRGNLRKALYVILMGLTVGAGTYILLNANGNWFYLGMTLLIIGLGIAFIMRNKQKDYLNGKGKSLYMILSEIFR